MVIQITCNRIDNLSISYMSFCILCQFEYLYKFDNIKKMIIYL